MISGIRRAMARVDSWLNTITAVGGTSSKVSTFTFEAREILRDETLQALYEQDGYATRIIDCVPDEGTRQGIILSTGDKAVDAAMAEELVRLGAHERITDAWCWGRLYGGGALFVGADDGLDPRKPLRLEDVRRVQFLTVLEKRELTPATWVTDQLDARFGDVETYRLSRGAGGGGTDTREVHVSRLIRFFGARVTPRRRAHLQGWGVSELQRVYDKLVQFNATYGALGELLQDGSQGVFAIKDLYSLMAQDKEGALKQRLELLDLSKSVAKSILVDADSERYERVESSAMTGYPDVIDRFALLLAGAAGIPVTILMGQAPAGLNATGDSDIRWFYDRVRTQQTNVLAPKMQRLAKILLAAKAGPSNGEALAAKVSFPPLWQPTPSEKADLRQKTSATDAAYITAGVLTPEEVAINRFGAEGWSEETVIDLEARRSALEADASLPAAGDAPGADHADGIAAVIARVAGREIPRDAGVALLAESFGLDPEAADRAMGEAGRTFFTAPEPTHAAEMEALRAEVAKLRASNQGHQAYTARVVKAAKEGGLELGAFTSQAPTAVAEGDDLQPGDVVAVTPEAP